VASASSEFSTSYAAYLAFDKSTATAFGSVTAYTNSVYGGSVTTVDTLGNSYAGEWLQIQVPVSTILNTFTLVGSLNGQAKNVKGFTILGSRDGLNWTQVYTNSNSGFSASLQSLSFAVSATQAYNYYRLVAQTTFATILNTWELIEWTLNGNEEGICVTNDSKVGVGIANPQRALEVAGDLVVSGTISGGAGMGAFRNRIINGDMRIDQRGPSSISVSGTVYSVDRWQLYCVSASGSVSTGQRTLTAADTPYQLGFRNSLRSTVTSAVILSGTNGTNYILPRQYIEAYNISDLNWGTSFGSPVTVSFWFYANAGGVYCSSIRTTTSSATFNTNFSALPNVWTYVTYTVPSPPNGTAINTGNLSGFELYIGNYNAYAPIPAVNTWSTSFPYQVAPQTANWWNNAGNYIEFTGVQLEKGTVATPFEFRPYATELALCQRYYETSYGPSTIPGTASQYQNFAIVKAIATNIVRGQVPFRISKRGNFTDSLASGAIYSFAGTLNRISNMGIGLSDLVLTTPTLTFLTGGWLNIQDAATPFTIGETYVAGWAASAEL
jgi:hypothetical protein